MNNEQATTVTLFKALSSVMSLLRQSAIALRKAHGNRLHSVTLQATPIPPHAFSFFLDADLPEPTTAGQARLGLTVDIKVSDETYVAEGGIGWHGHDTYGTAVASPWHHLEVPEWTSTNAAEFFEGLPGYVQELIARHEQALGECLRQTSS